MLKSFKSLKKNAKKEITPVKPGQNQYRRILDYMIDGDGSITSIEAFQYLGITKLSNRINEMIDKGMVDVKKETITENNRFGEPTHFTRYTLNDKRRYKKKNKKA